MLVLGLNGNFSPAGRDIVPGLQPWVFHDASATLVRDGVVLAAIEEERLNRIKKTTKFPVHAIRACMDQAGVSASEIDAVGYYCKEDFVDTILNQLYLDNPRIPARYSRELIKDWMRREFDREFTDDEIVYVPHHHAHAVSDCAHSGMDQALVVITDGRGEVEATTVYRADGMELTKLASYPFLTSLGAFYLAGTQRLGYGVGDEYKVMGLAPYGDPSVYRHVLDSLYTLKDNGGYDLKFPSMGFHPLQQRFAEAGLALRRKDEEFTQQHKNFAAAVQEALERITLHILRYWAERTELRNLVFGGGVAHNCSLNGVIARSGLFDSIFVHAASHDAGAGEGAALAAHQQLGGAEGPRARLRSVSWGPALGPDSEIEQMLAAWKSLITVERPADVTEWAAEALAGGAVLGWAHGRSEFGPRALGNRSILADPRPPQNQTRINAMVKKRESFRPFAPVVTEEKADTYFEIPESSANYDFMSFALHVRPEYRAELGAVTHIDGTARVQVLHREANPTFHRLISRFGELTGTSVLLNTSFNNNAEPIVQTVEDALTTYLTTDLDYLVVEDFVIRKRPDEYLAFDDFVLRFRPVTRLAQTAQSADNDDIVNVYEIYLDYATGPRTTVSAPLHALLRQADGKKTLATLNGGRLSAELRSELYGLWRERFFTLTPA
jgi:predicted NodU family carbamoyl transferase